MSSTQLRPILDKINRTEVYLQELELILLSQAGVPSDLSWNNIFKGAKPSQSNESVAKLSSLIESAEKVRKKIRHLGLECLSLQLAIENLDRIADHIEKEAKEVEQKLSHEGVIRSNSKDKNDYLQAIINSSINNGNNSQNKTIITN